MTIYVRGARSAIARALAEIHPVVAVPRGTPMPVDGEKYLFCAGLLMQKREVTEDEYWESIGVNCLQIVDQCDALLMENRRARICVMGSEAAFTGSFDETYAKAKKALHDYVETKRLPYPEQQLVCVAPSIVLNTGMTNARNEDGVAAMERRRFVHPKRRWLQPEEVARMINFLLCVDAGYTTGVVIRMNGGEHCG
jgi:NAD(P)-dependent dehydrogenase (short-subunit alcohol dehydrogenase family)